MPDSKHAAELQARGFTKLPGILKNRQMRRMLRKMKAGATFTQTTDVPLLTFATDDTHQSWVAKGLIDLSDLGFRSTTADVYADYQNLFGKEKQTTKQ